ncbi:hypothetical protein FHETE_4649 [Fusarium heterosporum]|uniref:Zn(2)-C6 fungal-type domain-containing protein n=1 Tax=Fusarium heterosporum TaxID=42747 RepID=A0A8H5THP7_FUSHE|nr:hypothetical protein FHETE_4649 [Fusarium heterosporum]
MVNRGGRSKACRTCKRRRVKCDHDKPSCQRCDKAGLTCGGYVTHGEFVDETLRFYRDDTPSEASQVQLQLFSTAPKSLERQIHHPSPLLLDQNALIHAHLLSKIADVEPLMYNINSSTSSPSTRALAIRALAGIYFGKTHNDKRILDTGSRDYVRALRRVQIDLGSPMALEWDTLASVICLFMFENIAFTNEMAWFKHYEGITQLVKLRGPWRHQAPLERELLRQCRFEIIVCALINRSHCYLALPEWRNIPWPPDVPKTASDALHDIFAWVPGQLHDMDRVEQGECDGNTFNNLWQRVETTLSDLEDWEQFHHHPRPLTNLSTSNFMHSIRDKALLALQRAVILSEIPAALEDQQAVKTVIANEICQLATSCIGHKTSGTEPLLFIFPLQIASMNFERGSMDERRADKVMNEVIAGTHGFEIGRRREWRPSSVMSVK